MAFAAAAERSKTYDKLWNRNGRGSNVQVDLIFKIAAVGLLVGFLNMVLRRAGGDDQALMMTIAGLFFVLLVLLELVGQLFTTFRQIFTF